MLIEFPTLAAPFRQSQKRRNRNYGRRGRGTTTPDNRGFTLRAFWRTPIVRLHMFHSDAGRTADTRPLQCRDVALGARKAKAPTKGLSTLNSMAFGLAVYASQCGLPRPTQNSLPAAGQALPDGLSTRKVPLKGFRYASYMSSSLPKLTWRNRADRSAHGYLRTRPFWYRSLPTHRAPTPAYLGGTEFDLSCRSPSSPSRPGKRCQFFETQPRLKHEKSVEGCDCVRVGFFSIHS